MGAYKREVIRNSGLPGIIEKYLNDNYSALWLKVFGDIDFADVTQAMLDRLFTYPLQPQGEGNLDPGHPLYVRFYIPENVEIKKGSLNAITSKYRMDSGITKSGGGTATGVSVSIGQSTKKSSIVKKWGSDAVNIAAPQYQFILEDATWEYGDMSAYLKRNDKNAATALGAVVMLDSVQRALLDLYLLQHEHDIDHTHENEITVDIPNHDHDLDEGIKESSVDPEEVTIYVNNEKVGVTMNGSDVEQNNIDILEHLKAGQYNIIKVTATSVARITLFGLVEIVMR